MATKPPQQHPPSVPGSDLNPTETNLTAMDDAPFDALLALNKDPLLVFEKGQNVSDMRPTPAPAGIEYLPGEPTVPLDRATVDAFLVRELDTPVLDELHEHLWWVARRSGSHIEPLNQHRNRQRQILATDEARLHLLWANDKLFVKRIPECLLNHDFWTKFLPPSTVPAPFPNVGLIGGQKPFDRKIALGFLRSYDLLIQSQLDFIIAQEASLIPKDTQWVTFAKFISRFRKFDDNQVSKRYQYGQIRAGRLDWAVRIHGPQSAGTRWFYELPFFSITSYLEQATYPLVFAFATISLVLSAMQVALVPSAKDLGFSGLHEEAVQRAFWIFSITLILLSGITWFLFLMIPAGVLIWQTQWGWRNNRRR